MPTRLFEAIQQSNLQKKYFLIRRYSSARCLRMPLTLTSDILKEDTPLL
jgi:hypothetical protein